MKAFSEYLGANQKSWLHYDACELLKHSRLKTPILVDQGSEDEFLERELFTSEFEQVVRDTSYPAEIRRQAGYDHSYYFVSTFIEDHLAFHAKSLAKNLGR